MWAGLVTGKDTGATWGAGLRSSEAGSALKGRPGTAGVGSPGAAREESLLQAAATSAPRGDTGLVSPRSGQATRRHQGGAGRGGAAKVPIGCPH